MPITYVNNRFAFHVSRTIIKRPRPTTLSRGESVVHVNVMRCSTPFVIELPENNPTLCSDVFDEVKKKTGVPQNLQILVYEGKQLCSLHRCLFKDWSTIYMSVKGVGGNGSDDGKYI